LSEKVPVSVTADQARRGPPRSRCRLALPWPRPATPRPRPAGAQGRLDVRCSVSILSRLRPRWSLRISEAPSRNASIISACSTGDSVPSKVRNRPQRAMYPPGSRRKSSGVLLGGRARGGRPLRRGRLCLLMAGGASCRVRAALPAAPPRRSPRLPAARSPPQHRPCLPVGLVLGG
jgi:hypothetical protein